MQAYDADLAAMAEARRPSVHQYSEKGVHANGLSEEKVSHDRSSEKGAYASDRPASSVGDQIEPTMEEMKTLRRISGKISWQCMTLTFVEFCERFSYYGTTAIFVNFLQQPRPYGSSTGAINDSMECFQATSEAACMQPGGLGRGQQTSTGLTTFNSFWAYFMPLLGGYIADTYLGRYLTIQWAILAAIIGHVLLIVSAAPTVMNNAEGALGCFAVGLVIMGIGTGGFKSNISPLIAEQIRQKRPWIVTLKSGERVVQDPQVTISRVFLYFYMMINVGSLSGGIGMVYVERYVGFWLAYALPTFLFLLAPIVLLVCKKQYHLNSPTGDVTSRAFRLLSLATKKHRSANPVRMYRNMQDADFWHSVKPSRLGSTAPAWMEGIDDAWVEQVARGFNACKVFFWMPLYWLAYNQMTNNLTSQSATMQLNGVPNDLINNLNPITLVIFIPIVDNFVYPALRKYNIRFTPLQRITWGFFIASAAMVASCVIQYYIYTLSPCEWTEVQSNAECKAPINVWVQAVPYCLVAFSEIFASITGLEYAFSKAPENMRGLVMGVNLLQTAFSAAIGQAFNPLVVDPRLVINYGLVAGLAFAGGIGFWLTWRSLDAKEDELNTIAATKYKGRTHGLEESERV